jgi:regulator of protease activity HflC (stomatin/prohibitin superfamily)
MIAHKEETSMLSEREIKGLSGWLMIFVLLAGVLLSVSMLVSAIKGTDVPWILVWIPVLVVDAVCWAGLTVVNPNEAKVVQLFGVYKGSIKQQGLWWVNPLTSRRTVSLRIRNFESSRLKVNDHDGNPIEIAAVVVWRVIETAEAVFHVDDYENFVHVQSESAVRNLATTYPYDAHQEGQLSLRMSAGEIAHRLRQEIQDRLSKAGVEVIEARISHLAYAPEIANAMLRRQQASAIIAARQKIVEGAVGMVEMALELLNTKQVVQLDEERKAAMVSNLLVVLCSDRDAQPVVNTGTLYQ